MPVAPRTRLLPLYRLPAFAAADPGQPIPAQAEQVDAEALLTQGQPILGRGRTYSGNGRPDDGIFPLLGHLRCWR